MLGWLRVWARKPESALPANNEVVACRRLGFRVKGKPAPAKHQWVGQIPSREFIESSRALFRLGGNFHLGGEGRAKWMDVNR